MGYEDGGLSDFKIIYLWAKIFVVPSLNVVTICSLFLILCCDIVSAIN